MTAIWPSVRYHLIVVICYHMSRRMGRGARWFIHIRPPRCCGFYVPSVICVFVSVVYWECLIRRAFFATFETLLCGRPSLLAGLAIPDYEHNAWSGGTSAAPQDNDLVWRVVVSGVV